MPHALVRQNAMNRRGHNRAIVNEAVRVSTQLVVAQESGQKFFQLKVGYSRIVTLIGCGYIGTASLTRRADAFIRVQLTE